MSSNVESETKLLVDSLTLYEDDEITSGIFIMGGIDSVSLLKFFWGRSEYREPKTGFQICFGMNSHSCSLNFLLDLVWIVLDATRVLIQCGIKIWQKVYIRK